MDREEKDDLETGKNGLVKAPRSRIKDSDIRTVAIVGGLAAAMLLIFGVAVFLSGLIEFPTMSNDTKSNDPFRDAMIYRERRVYLALVFRTFLTGFSFVVGLALSTMGGLFILRQVTSLTTISGGVGQGGLMVKDGTDEAHQKALADTQFAFKSYSPGVVFMVGGVIVMTVSQSLAIPVTTIEIVPSQYDVWRQSEKNGLFDRVKTAQPQMIILEQYQEAFFTDIGSKECEEANDNSEACAAQEGKTDEQN